MSDDAAPLAISGMAGHLIRRLHQRSAQVFQRHARAAGVDLTPVQFAAMQAICARPGIDQAGVAELIAYDRATIGGVIERLLQKGLVARRVKPEDRRARVLDLTPEGEALHRQFLPVVAAFQDEILDGLDEDDRAAFNALAARALDLDGEDVESG
ncbi:MarR family transcriptional regulator [Rhodobacterales bacterium HKCCE2091]|nr:MarR family transcriptional regulator [Rhodobacterales bacterium HKCCE2091]